MGTVDTLLKPENKDMLAKVLTYHAVAGQSEHGRHHKDDQSRTRHRGTENRERRNTVGPWKKMAEIMLKDEKGGISTIEYRQRLSVQRRYSRWSTLS